MRWRERVLNVLHAPLSADDPRREHDLLFPAQHPACCLTRRSGAATPQAARSVSPTELKVKDGAGPRPCHLIAFGRDGSE